MFGYGWGSEIGWDGDTGCMAVWLFFWLGCGPRTSTDQAVTVRSGANVVAPEMARLRPNSFRRAQTANLCSSLFRFPGYKGVMHSLGHDGWNLPAQFLQVVPMTLPETSSASAGTERVSLDLLARQKMEIVADDLFVRGNS